MSFDNLVDRNMDGEEIKMAKFLGDVLLVVNVASECGLTASHYTQLPKLYDEYHSQGFQILAFPCNQFAEEEPGTHAEIIEFVKSFDANMPQKLVFFEKADVNGPNAREVYRFLKQKLPNEAASEAGSSEISWNFEKFLVDRTGEPYKRYSPNTEPLDMKNDIDALLMNKVNS